MRAKGSEVIRTALAALGTIAVLAGIWFVSRERWPPAATPAIQVRLTLEAGSANYPAISADVKLLAFASDPGSMENTLLVGDHLLVDKLAYAPVDTAHALLIAHRACAQKVGDVVKALEQQKREELL